jgi:hypothetical protein
MLGVHDELSGGLGVVGIGELRVADELRPGIQKQVSGPGPRTGAEGEQEGLGQRCGAVSCLRRGDQPAHGIRALGAQRTNGQGCGGERS